MSQAGNLNERRPRVLAVEDEVVVAMLLEDMLGELGYEPVGPLHRLSDALEAARCEEVDAAIVDVNLAGESSYPVAELLDGRGIPVIFATGYGSDGLAPSWRLRPTLRKPYSIDDLQNILAATIPATRG